MSYSSLKAAVAAVVRTNGVGDIKGSNLQSTLFAMIDSIGAGYQFAGIAQTDGQPGAPDQNVFFLAGPGTYPNYGAVTIPTGYIGVLMWNGSWTSSTMAVTSSVGGASWGTTTASNYSPLIVGDITKTVALDGHTQSFASVLVGVSGTKEDGVVVQWDASLNSGQGGWKFATVGGGASGEYLPIDPGSSNPLQADLYAMNIIPRNSGYTLGNSGAQWHQLYVGDIYAESIRVSDYASLGNNYLAYIDDSTGLIRSSVLPNTAYYVGGSIAPTGTGPHTLGSTSALWDGVYINYPATNAANSKGVYSYASVGGTPQQLPLVTLLTQNEGSAQTPIWRHYLDVGGYYVAEAGRVSRVYGKSVDLVIRDAVYVEGVLTKQTRKLSFQAASNQQNYEFVPDVNGNVTLGSASFAWGSVYTRTIRSSQAYVDLYVKNAAGTAEEIVCEFFNSGVYCRKSLVPYLNVTDIDLGRADRLWNALYVKRWYPTSSASQDAPYIGYDNQQGFYVNGDLVVNGNISTDTNFVDYLDLTAPTIRYVLGTDSLGDPITPMMTVQHPLLYDTRIDARPVLMIWSKRRGRSRTWGDLATPDRWQYTRGRWGEARGKYATNAPLLFTLVNSNGEKSAYRSIADIQTFVLQHFICGIGYSRAQMEAMTLATFKSLGNGTFRFGGRHSSNETPTTFKKNTKGTRMFGIAIRYTNPKFLEAWDGTSPLAETTRQIKNSQNQNVPRYIYSEVVPFMMDCHRVVDDEANYHQAIGVQMQPISAPHA